MSMFNIYFLLKLADFSILLAFISLLLFFAAFVIGGVGADKEGEERKRLRSRGFNCIIAALILGVISFVIPSKKDLILMYSGSYLSGSEEIKTLPLKGDKALNIFLDDYVEKEETQR